CQSRAPMHLPRGNLPTHIRQLARIDRWQEPRKRPPFRLVEGFPGTKRIPTERERHHWIIPAPPAVLAVHYLRLFRVQPQSDFGEPTPDRVPHLPGLTFGHTMDHHIVCETFEPDTRELPSHPQIEAVMQKKIGEQRGDRAALWRPLYPVGESPIRHPHRGFQPALHIQQDPLLIRVTRDRLQYQIPRHRVEESLHV